MTAPLAHSKALQDFCKAFDAYPEKSNRKFYKQTMVDWTDYNDPNVHYKVEDIDAVALHIPLHRLDEFLGIVDEQKYRELSIRNQVPAVKLAYERYKMLLKMCGGDYNAGY